MSSRLRAWHVDATSFRNRYRALQQEHRAQQQVLADLSDRLGNATVDLRPLEHESQLVVAAPLTEQAVIR